MTSTHRRPLNGAPALLTALVLAVVLAACGGPGTRPTAAAGVAPGGAAGGGSATAPLHLVGLGDSVMAGAHCACAGIPAEYAAALARRTGRRVLPDNIGADGLVTRDVLDALRTDARTRNLVRSADVVLLDIGANDLEPQLRRWNAAACPTSCFRAPAERMGDRVRRILRAVASIRSADPDTVLVLDYWNVFTDGDVARRQGGQRQLDWSSVVTDTANAAICRAAAATGARCVDTVAPFKGDGTADPTRLLAGDGDHPNAAGVRRIVASLVAATPTRILDGRTP